METLPSTITPVRSAFTKLMLAGFILVFTATTASASGSDPVKKDKEITVTAVGVENAEIIFNVKHQNSNEDKLFIALTDKEGVKLYNEIVSVKNFDKTFKINAEVGTVYLVVTNTRTRSQERFEISPRSRVVEDISISTVQ